MECAGAGAAGDAAGRFVRRASGDGSSVEFSAVKGTGLTAGTATGRMDRVIVLELEATK